ncbi:hypothetical protein [Ensifer aridi]|uniref:hypothetical protein n=1 Tax=Ensifer aridi TaxID=1708715 RepID=UPI00111C0478|nr:hypothetical protein [Ensifer aridi]
MSTCRIIIFARNPKTGETRLPLSGLEFADEEGEEEAKRLLEVYRRGYPDDWELSLYQPLGETVKGGAKGA